MARSWVGVLAGRGRGRLPHGLFDGQQMMPASPQPPLPHALGRSGEGVREGTCPPAWVCAAGPDPALPPGVCAIHSAPWLPLGNTHLKNM